MQNILKRLGVFAVRLRLLFSILLKTSTVLPDYDVSRYWDDCIAAVNQHKDDHVWAFWQVHGMLASIGACQEETTQQVMKSVKDFIKYVNI